MAKKRKAGGADTRSGYQEGAEARTSEQATDEELLIEEDQAEDSALTRRQIILLGAVGFLSFLLFFVAFFPFEGIIRTILKSRLPEGIRLEFTEFRPSLLGTTRAQGLLVAKEPGLRLEAEGASLEFKLLGLLRSSPRGTARLNDGSFSGGPLSGSFKSAEVVMDLNDVVHRPARDWEGTFQLRVNQFEPDQLPQIGLLQKLPLAPADLTVSRLQVKLTFGGGVFQINQGELQNTLFHLRAEGSGRPGGDPSSTALDARLCIKPVDDLEARNATLAGLYSTMVGGGSGETCLKVTGTLGSPAFAPADAAPAPP